MMSKHGQPLNIKLYLNYEYTQLQLQFEPIVAGSRQKSRASIFSIGEKSGNAFWSSFVPVSHETRFRVKVYDDLYKIFFTIFIGQQRISLFQEHNLIVNLAVLTVFC